MGTTLVPADSSIFKRGGVANRVLCLVLAVALVATITVLPTGRAEAATTTIKIPVTYGQTEARSMLQMLNDFRASKDAWYWKEDNKTKQVLTDLQPLEYDYALEQVAMLRAAEIAFSYSHTRPNGTTCFTAAEGRPLYFCGENIAVGTGSYGSKSSIFDSWREDNEEYAVSGLFWAVH